MHNMVHANMASAGGPPRVRHFRDRFKRIQVRKRSMYGKRYAMMDTIEAQLTTVVHSRTVDAAARRAA